jgi:hypothetical protein
VISQALLGGLVDPLPLARRLLVIAHCVALAVGLGMDLCRGRFEQSFPELPATLVRWVVAGIIILLTAAVLATVAGDLGAALVLRNLVLGGRPLLISRVAGQIYGLTLALMHTRAEQPADRPPASARLAQYLQGPRGGSLGLGVRHVVMLGLGAKLPAHDRAHAELTIGSTSIDLTGVWWVCVLGTVPGEDSKAGAGNRDLPHSASRAFRSRCPP